jgi:hypothetical protein
LDGNTGPQSYSNYVTQIGISSDSPNTVCTATINLFMSGPSGEPKAGDVYQILDGTTCDPSIWPSNSSEKVACVQLSAQPFTDGGGCAPSVVFASVAGSGAIVIDSVTKQGPNPSVAFHTTGPDGGNTVAVTGMASTGASGTLEIFMSMTATCFTGL